MKINHVAIYIKDLEKTREFYEKYFEARANEKYHNKNTGLQTYFLTFPDSEARLEIMSRPELSERNDKIMKEINYENKSCSNLCKRFRKNKRIL